MDQHEYDDKYFTYPDSPLYCTKTPFVKCVDSNCNDDEKYKPCSPLLLYKHYLQVRYNQGKPGLDKNTEMGMRVYHQHKSSFETKYVLTLLDRILVNAWRAEVAVTILKP